MRLSFKRRAILYLVFGFGASACAQPDLEAIKVSDLKGARLAFESNIAAIQEKDVAKYLSQYLDSPEFIVASADSLARGYLLFAEARRASNDWPDTLIAGTPTLVWIAPGVVWGAYRYVGVQEGDTARGWSERLLVNTSLGWQIAVTGVMQR